MSQEQRDGEQPWVLAGGQAGETGPTSTIEVVGDVEFFEEGVAAADATSARPSRAFGQFPKDRRGGACRRQCVRPGRAQASRSSSVGSCFVGVWIRRAWQTPPAERPALGAKAATCATDVARGG